MQTLGQLYESIAPDPQNQNIREACSSASISSNKRHMAATFDNARARTLPLNVFKHVLIGPKNNHKNKSTRDRSMLLADLLT